MDGLEDRTLSGVAHAALIAARPVRYERRRPARRGARYREHRRLGVAPRVDIYLPDNAPPSRGHPSLLLLHGGGFLIGSRNMRAIRFLASALCARGIAVACPDYRLLFRGGPLSTQLADVAEVRRFWRGQATDLALDPDRMAVGGLSAGGTLALLEAAAAGNAYHRVVGIYGLYDFCDVSGPGVGFVRRRLLESPDPAAWLEASPLAKAAQFAAPLLLVHGTEDLLVPFAQAEAVRAQRPHRTELLRFDGMPHGWLQDPSLPESTQLAAAVAHFLLEPDDSPLDTGFAR